ncbi:hypothetical protein D9M68_289080 [compost metagenome]
MPVQHRQQHGQAVLVEAEGDPARIAEVAGIDQRLHFHQHRPRAFPGRHHHAARHRFLGAGEEDRRRVGDFLQALVGHAEHAQLVHRAEAVLHRPQQAQAAIGFALEIEHGVHHVLQHAGAGQGAFLGHMTDQEDRRAALLGEAHQQRRALAHLGHAAGGRLQLFGEDGLDGVDHHYLGFFHPRRGDDAFDAGLGHDLELVFRQAEAAGAHGDLLLGFLAGDVQRRHAAGDVAEGLQEDGGLADAGIAADQHHRTVHQAAAEDAVEFGGSGAEARGFLDADLGQGLDVGLLPGPAAPPGGAAGRAFEHGFDQGVPGAAFAALTGPFGEGGAALGAAVHALGLGHGRTPSGRDKARMIAANTGNVLRRSQLAGDWRREPATPGLPVILIASKLAPTGSELLHGNRRMGRAQRYPSGEHPRMRSHAGSVGMMGSGGRGG